MTGQDERGGGVDVSVVVPCYNTERYLDQALASAEQNDRVSLEIIVLNDGSTDGSLDVMRRHEGRDARVRVIDKPNQGYGATVNRGFAEARGTYLAILEPDDWVEPHMYDDLFDFARSFCLKTPPDVVKSPYWRIWMPGTPDERRLNCAYFRRIRPSRQPFTLGDCPRLVQHHPSIWSALYRAGFIRDRSIRFKEVPGAGWVDNPFWYETLCQAETIVYLDTPYYCYREDLPGSSSATRDLALSFDRWQDMCDVCDRLGVTDEGVRRALAVVGFRYAGEAMAQGALEDADLRARMGAIFSRMDAETILSLDNVAPRLRELAFRLSGREVPRVAALGYARGLVREFSHSLGINGVGFALAQTRRYLRRRASQNRRGPRRDGGEGQGKGLPKSAPRKGR
ncbi:glycosyltransferase [Olsenella sp. HMSC062G07]|uniref:glycosyltransferase family 2 protein n=1 Tax=Olsenella sp. HMSC062G07 TaxID=1739330 RepID=UPI0008A3DD49|nr:glycosyltransferase [Olsenella sp. HMSC062G07]